MASAKGTFSIFTVMPLIYMILMALTNYDQDHQPPGNLFTWVGLENFKNIVSFSGAGIGGTFVQVLLWTLVWAFLATFTNYFLGLAVAMLINKRGIKFKRLWRTILVLTIAVDIQTVDRISVSIENSTERTVAEDGVARRTYGCPLVFRRIRRPVVAVRRVVQIDIVGEDELFAIEIVVHVDRVGS